MAEKKAGTRGISDETVREKTGKSLAEWFKILDEWGMKEKGHTLTARYLEQQHGVSPWWSQMLTVRYEYERGLR